MSSPSFDEPLCRNTAQVNWTVLFFSENRTDQKTAINLCNRCPYVEPCAAYAIPIADLYGVWGGLTAEDRQRIRRAEGIKSRNVRAEVDRHVFDHSTVHLSARRRYLRRLEKEKADE